MNKNDLINKIKKLDGINDDERAYLINLVNTKKKYGLVWEDKPEDVEEQLRTHLPVLKEVVEKRILSKDLPKAEIITPKAKEATLFDNDEITVESNSSPLERSGEARLPSEVEAPNHILIEGDNLHALTALTFTHEGQIDVMYFDPPYNTGNKDFKYNDSFVDKEDSYRHSKWLSFMHKRLEIAKRLLSEKGVVFISIDDYEQATLKLLCDEIFSEMNFVGNIIWQRAFSPINLKKTISQNHDFILIYCKQDFNTFELNKLPRTENANNRYKNPDNDPRGPWTSSDLTVGPVIEEKLYKITTPSGSEYYPPKGRCWVVSENRYKELLGDNQIWFGENGNNMPRRKKFLTEVRDGVVAMSLWTYQEVGHTQDAKKELKEILHENEKPFETVKPIKLIDRIFKLTTDNKKPYKILDFFAGSGTTLHATLQLNAEDGGNRQCILVTNNENNICEEVTYERNKRVIQGYTNAKGVWVDGLTNNNLRYYKTDFVSRQPNLKNKRELTRLATELLCIKEDCYTPNNDLITDKNIRIFENDKIVLVVIYDDTIIDKAVELIKTLIKNTEIDFLKKIKVYVFSNGQYPYTEEFEEVLEYVTLCALPDAIYKAYQNVLPKKQREVVPELEEENLPTEESDLFKQTNNKK